MLALVAVCLQACGQTCDGGILQANGNAYAYRVGGTVVTYSQAYATGSDAEYTTTAVTLTSTFNGQTIGSSPSGSAGPNGFARATQNSAVSAIGYGTYQAQGYVTLFDSCTGRTYPPYDTGGPYTNVASLTVVQPVASFLSSAIEPSGIYANQYPQFNKDGGSTPVYSTTGTLSSNTEGAAGTPVWTLTGRTGAVTTSCTTCAYITVATNANAAALARCGPAVSAYFTVDGLTSTTTNFMILSVIQLDATSPTTNQHADHQAITGGYQSLWYFLVQDNCGVPMQYVAVHEEFPNSFSYKVQHSNWNFPKPDAWWTSSVGGSKDTILFSDTSCQAIPTPTNPQSPLNPTVIFNGLQKIYVDPVLVLTTTQAHYLDHGGYQ